jgi:hypothetical protein
MGGILEIGFPFRRSMIEGGVGPDVELVAGFESVVVDLLIVSVLSFEVDSLTTLVAPFLWSTAVSFLEVCGFVEFPLLLAAAAFLVR